MAQSASVPIDFRALKKSLAGSDQRNPANCGVVILNDGTASLRVDRRKKPKVLARELLEESKEAGVESSKCFFGSAYMDEFPGTLSLTLNKAPSSLNTKLRVALRGSGFNKIDITVDEDVAE